MQIVYRDLWDIYFNDGDLICITTNGTVKKNGEAVMGAGCAKDCTKHYPWFPAALGSFLSEHANVCYRVGHIITFPVKHNWYEEADIELIKESFKDMLELVGDQIVYLPKLGCGNGKLSWEEVKQALQPLYKSNVIFVDYKENLCATNNKMRSLEFVEHPKRDKRGQ